MHIDMRTSVDIPDDLFKKAKLAAVERGVSMRELIIRGLQRSLSETSVKPDASRLPKLPTEGRSAYDLSNQELDAILAAEEASAYGNPGRR